MGETGVIIERAGVMSADADAAGPDCHAVTGVTVDKSEAQLLFERLLEVWNRLYAVEGRLTEVKRAIGIDAAREPSVLKAKPAAPMTQFFPALRLLTDALEKTTAEVAASVDDLARRF